jgi:microcystin-dependent protein
MTSNIKELPMTLQYPDSSIGDIKFISHEKIPDGWMECAGQAISRTTFIELFNRIGTLYGAGDGTTTFNIPDLRGEFPRGWDHGRGIDSGRTLGSKQTDTLQGHLHAQYVDSTVQGSVLTSPQGRSNGINYESLSITGPPISDGTHGAPRIASETRPCNIALIYIIKVKNIAGYDPYVYRGNALTLGGIPASGFLLSTQGINFKNKIINGNFDIWQRGTSFTTGYTADRWGNFSIGSTNTVSRQLFGLEQTDVPNEPTYFLRNTVTSVLGTGNAVDLQYRVESVRTLAGKTVTLSFWAKADSNKYMAIGFNQYFGSGGSPSAIVEGIGVQKIALTSIWKKYIITINVPSIAGKTIGTSSNDYLGIVFWFDAGSNFNTQSANLGQQSGTFDIAQVQLEEGSVDTSFEQRPIGLELQLCQRFFYKTFPLYVYPIRAATTTAGSLATVAVGSCISIAVRFPQIMRITPTILTYNPFDGTSTWRQENGADITPYVGTPSDQGCELYAVSGLASGNNNWIHITADAEL